MLLSCSKVIIVQFSSLLNTCPGGRGTAIYGPYGYVPL